MTRHLYLVPKLPPQDPPPVEAPAEPEPVRLWRAILDLLVGLLLAGAVGLVQLVGSCH